MISPLPFVFKFRFIFRLIIGCIQIMNSCFKTCIHDRQVLVWECNMDYHISSEIFNLLDQGLHIHRINRRCRNPIIPYRFLDFITLRFRPARQQDPSEYILLFRTFVRNHPAYPAGSDDNNVFFHSKMINESDIKIKNHAKIQPHLIIFYNNLFKIKYNRTMNIDLSFPINIFLFPIHKRSERSTNTAENMNRSEEHTSELQSRGHLVCRLLLEKKKKHKYKKHT